MDSVNSLLAKVREDRADLFLNEIVSHNEPS